MASSVVAMDAARRPMTCAPRPSERRQDSQSSGARSPVLSVRRLACSATRPVEYLLGQVTSSTRPVSAPADRSVRSAIRIVSAPRTIACAALRDHLCEWNDRLAALTGCLRDANTGPRDVHNSALPRGKSPLRRVRSSSSARNDAPGRKDASTRHAERSPPRPRPIASAGGMVTSARDPTAVAAAARSSRRTVKSSLA